MSSSMTKRKDDQKRDNLLSGESLEDLLEAMHQKATRSKNSSSLSNPFSHDMDQILSPTMDSTDNNNNNNNNSVEHENNIHHAFSGTTSDDYSTDSIIRRVEAEIAAARQSVTEKQTYDDDWDDMRKILDVKSDEQKVVMDDDQFEIDQPVPSQDDATWNNLKECRTAEQTVDNTTKDTSQTTMEQRIWKTSGPLGPFLSQRFLSTNGMAAKDEGPLITHLGEFVNVSEQEIEVVSSVVVEDNTKDDDDDDNLDASRSSSLDRIQDMLATNLQQQSNQEDEKSVPFDEKDSPVSSSNNKKKEQQQDGPFDEQSKDRNNKMKQEESDDAVRSVDVTIDHLDDDDEEGSSMSEVHRAREILDSLRVRREEMNSVIRTSHALSQSAELQVLASKIDKLANNSEDNESPRKMVRIISGGATTEEEEPVKEEHRAPSGDSSPSEKTEDKAAESSTEERRITPTGTPPRNVEKTPQQTESSSTPRRSMGANRRSGGEEAVSCSRSRRIRFRDPFPVLKPTIEPRSPEEIIAEHAVEPTEVPKRWIRPKQELKELIVAAMGSSLHRRSNACGALKVLTRSKKNRLTMVRTDSFLEALIYTASQEIPSFRDRELAIDARTRAIACIRNVCEPKENRAHVFSHPGVVECLHRVIEEDGGEARMLACGTLALLARTPECREGIVGVEGLVDLLAEVMSGALVTPLTPVVSEEKKEDDHLEDCPSTFSENSHSILESDHEDDHSHDGSISTDSSHESNDSRSSHDEAEEDQLELRQVDSIRKRHEDKHDEYQQQARSNACAAILHLSKHCAVSQQLCSSRILMDSLIKVSAEIENHIHSKCLEILCNMTRFPANNSTMTLYEGLVELLLEAAASKTPVDRIMALRCFQNMSGDGMSKLPLATDSVLSLMTSCAMHKSPEEKEAAVATLYNITTEPGAVVAITNTKNVVATLVHIAHNPESTPTIRLLACEALATISLWLQTLAGTGNVPQGLPNIPLPSQKTSGWERWD